jgi:hypothetical protein
LNIKRNLKTKGDIVTTIYEKIPEFGQFAEFVTQAPPQGEGEEVYLGIEINRVSLSQFLEGENVQQVLETVEQDYHKIEKLRTIEPIADAERTKLAEVYHGDVVAYATQDMDTLKIIEKLKEIVSYPDWRVGEKVMNGKDAEDGRPDVRMYEKQLYSCVISHTTQSDWTPDITPALWKKFYGPNVIPDWVQPLGAHDAYNIGDRVRFNGKIYESRINANVWSPLVYGWREIVL